MNAGGHGCMACDGEVGVGVTMVLAAMPENPAAVVGTFRLSEPTWIPEPSLLSFVYVTVRVAGLLVTLPAESLTITENFEPLSEVVVAGVV